VSAGNRQRAKAKAEAKGARQSVRRSAEYWAEALMFLDQPDIDFTLEQWCACRDFYLGASYDPLMPENIVFACRLRARFAAENVRRSVREIEDLELLWEFD
jgi:hypothetical protein